MDYPLDGCWTKVEIAGRHLHGLNTDIGAWLKGHPNPVSSHFYPDAKVQVFWWEVPHPPLEWGVRIGDAIHNLRSALDHLVWQLTSDPKAGPGGNQFPILRTAPNQGFDARTQGGMLHGVAPDHREKIERLQPYVRTPGSENDNELVLLNGLSNVDKHQVIPTLAIGYKPSSGPPFQAFGGNQDAGPIKSIWVAPDTTLKPGAVFACFDTYGPIGPNPQVNVKGGPTVQIRLEDGRNAIKTVSDIAQAVEAIINHFIPDFPGYEERSVFYGREPGVIAVTHQSLGSSTQKG